MNKDTYGEIINGNQTYKEIAEGLVKNHAVLIGWTEQAGSHFDILFTYLPYVDFDQYIGRHLNFQGGIEPSDLFISVMRAGSFGFEIKRTDTDWTYYQEKLTFNFGETTGTKLAELINNVKKELLKIKIK